MPSNIKKEIILLVVKTRTNLLYKDNSIVILNLSSSVEKWKNSLLE